MIVHELTGSPSRAGTRALGTSFAKGEITRSDPDTKQGLPNGQVEPAAIAIALADATLKRSSWRQQRLHPRVLVGLCRSHAGFTRIRSDGNDGRVGWHIGHLAESRTWVGRDILSDGVWVQVQSGLCSPIRWGGRAWLGRLRGMINASARVSVGENRVRQCTLHDRPCARGFRLRPARHEQE